MTDAVEAAAKAADGIHHVVRTEVSHLDALDVVPHAFGGIQIGGIGREPLDGEPRLAGHEARHVTAAMCGQAIPDQDDVLSLDEPAELLEESDEAFGVKAAFDGS